MNPKKYDAILPQTRISGALMRKLVKVSESQEMKLAEVVRMALKEYVRPHPKAVAVPIVGTIKEDDKEYIVIPTSLLGGGRGAALPPNGNSTPEMEPTGQRK